MQELKGKMKRFADIVYECRQLSEVCLEGIETVADYRKLLEKNNETIEKLDREGKEIFSGVIRPLIDKKERLTPGEADALVYFCDLLLEPSSGEELDLFLEFEISERLCREFRETGNDTALAKQLNIHISVCYVLVSRTARLTIDRGLCTKYRDEGLKAAEEAKAMLFDRDRFLSMENKGRIELLRAARFYSALYDTFYFEEETNNLRFLALVEAYRLSMDPFYTENVKDYPWYLHRCRCIEHMGQLTERGDRWGFRVDRCREIRTYLQTELKEMWDEDKSGRTIRKILPEAHYRLIILRNDYFAGEIELETYRDELLSLYRQYRSDKYDMYAAQMNILIPTEYLCTLQNETLSARTEEIVRTLYAEIADYILHSANTGAFIFLQEYLAGFLEEFIELPGLVSFAETALSCLVALHPETYIHSIQAAKLARCLTEHMIRLHPERLVGILGFSDVSAVKENRSAITNHLYHAALYRDIGKVLLVDSLFVVGRDRTEEEKTMLDLHGRMGEAMLYRHRSTAPYAHAAASHHDPDVVSEEGWEYTEAELLHAAGCLEYGAKKTFSPELTEVLSETRVKRDLFYLLSEGRDKSYLDTFILLSGVQSRADSGSRDHFS